MIYTLDILQKLQFAQTITKNAIFKCFIIYLVMTKSTFSQPRSYYTQKREQQQVEKKWLVSQGQMPTHDSRRPPSIGSRCANAKSSVREYERRIHMSAKVIKMDDGARMVHSRFSINTRSF